MNLSSAPPPAARHLRGLLLMLFSTACFTTNVLLIRTLGELQRVDIWLVSGVRFAVGLALVAIFYRRDFQPAHLWRNGKLAQRGLIGGLGVYAFYLTIVQLGAGRATFINTTYVIWGALLAVWLLGERFRLPLAFGSVAALTGLGLLTNAFAGGARPSPYDLLAVTGAFASAWVVVTIRQLHATEHTSTIFAAQCAYGLLICALPALLHRASIAPLAWVVMTLAGCFAAGGQIAMTRAFRDLPVAEGSLLQMLVPVGIAAGGCLLFGERFAPHELIGGGLILAGTAFTAIRRQRPAA